MKKEKKQNEYMFWIKGALGICAFIVCGHIYNTVNQYIANSTFSIQSNKFQEHAVGEIFFSSPPPWVLVHTPYGNHGDLDVIAIVDIPFQSFPNIIIREYDSTIELQQIVDTVTLRNQKEKNYTLLSSEHEDINELKSVILTYIYTSETPVSVEIIKCKDILLIEKKGYSLSFCAFEEDWSSYELVFEEMIKTIKRKN